MVPLLILLTSVSIATNLFLFWEARYQKKRADAFRNACKQASEEARMQIEERKKQVLRLNIMLGESKHEERALRAELMRLERINETYKRQLDRTARKEA